MSKSSEEDTAASKKGMINALEVHLGNVTAAAQALGITPRTHYRWLKEDGEYADAAEGMRDICYRRVKDRLIEKALKKIDKGDSAVLIKMLSIFLKKLPEEMDRLAMFNRVPLIRPVINYVDTREQAEEIMRSRGEM